jgi:uncharacterized UPF0160 family protein
MKRLVTHNGKFHADDVFATAVLRKVFKEVEVIRSRDDVVIASGDIVYDVGNAYDPSTNRFDHHQVGGAGTRENGIPYAAFGLVWKHFGRQLCSSDEVWQTVDERLVERVDATDTGYASPSSLNVPTLDHYVLDTVASAFNPAWNEPFETNFAAFMELVTFAERLLEREIIRSEAVVLGKTLVEKAYQEAAEKEIIVLEQMLPWREVLVSHPEPKFVIYPSPEDGKFLVQGVHAALNGYEVRVRFPKAWGGLRDGELATVNGIPGSTFCHSAGFLAGNETLGGALQMAKQALA